MAKLNLRKEAKKLVSQIYSEYELNDFVDYRGIDRQQLDQIMTIALTNDKNVEPPILEEMTHELGNLVTGLVTTYDLGQQFGGYTHILRTVVNSAIIIPTSKRPGLLKKMADHVEQDAAAFCPDYQLVPTFSVEVLRPAIPDAIPQTVEKAVLYLQKQARNFNKTPADKLISFEECYGKPPELLSQNVLNGMLRRYIPIGHPENLRKRDVMRYIKQAIPETAAELVDRYGVKEVPSNLGLDADRMKLGVARLPTVPERITDYVSFHFNPGLNPAYRELVGRMANLLARLDIK